MREYFTNLLLNLDKLTGIQQYNKLMQNADWKTEINTLLDILCRVCEQFPYIPDAAKQKIIDGCIVADQEFIGLNAKVVFKWLNLNKAPHFREASHVPTEPEAPPLEGEARAARIQEFLDVLAKVDTAMTEKSKVRPHIPEEWKAPAGEKYHQPSPDVMVLQDLRIEYGRLHTNKYTGDPLEGHPTWEDYLKQQTEQK